MAWADRVDELLYEGERVRESVDVDDARVVVTTHRVLAFTPTDGSGPNYRAIDLPNVTRVTAGGESDGEALQQAIVWGVFGIVLVGGGIAFEMGSLFSLPETLESGAVGGTGGIVSGFRTLVSLLSLLDEAVAVVGVGALAVGAVSAYRYLDSREHVVTLAVAGDDDVRLPVTGASTDPSTASPHAEAHADDRAGAARTAATAADRIREALGAAAVDADRS